MRTNDLVTTPNEKLMGVSLSKSAREVCPTFPVKLQNAKVQSDLETLVHANPYFALAPLLRFSRDRDKEEEKKREREIIK